MLPLKQLNSLSGVLAEDYHGAIGRESLRPEVESLQGSEKG